MIEWDRMTPEQWAQLSAEARDELDTSTWALMELAKRVAERLRVETSALLTDAEGAIDDVEWRGTIDGVEIQLGLPDLEVTANAPIAGMIGLHLDRAADDDEHFVEVGMRVTAVAPSAAVFRKYPDAVQREICQGMRDSGIRWLSIDDEGIEATIRDGYILRLADPVGEIAGALTFIAWVGRFVGRDQEAQ